MTSCQWWPWKQSFRSTSMRFEGSGAQPPVQHLACSSRNRTCKIRKGKLVLVQGHMQTLLYRQSFINKWRFAFVKYTQLATMCNEYHCEAVVGQMCLLTFVIAEWKTKAS